MIGGCLLTTWQIENKGSQSAAVQYTMGPTSLFISIYLQTISKYYFSVFFYLQQAMKKKWELATSQIIWPQYAVQWCKHQLSWETKLYIPSTINI